jgi:hypothetical protein
MYGYMKYMVGWMDGWKGEWMDVGCMLVCVHYESIMYVCMMTMYLYPHTHRHVDKHLACMGG